MIREVGDRDVVAAFVREAKRQLADGRHDDAAYRAATALGLDAATPRDAARRLAGRLPDDAAGPETAPGDQAPFISRDPLVSLIQSSLEAELHRTGAVQETPAGHPHHGLFTHIWARIEDIFEQGRLAERHADFAAEVVAGTLRRLAEGTYPFNPEPAEQVLGARARLIVVGDWGSGLRRARAVAALMAAEVAAGLEQGREVQVIHLGDCYWSGEAEEYERHVLADGWWPVGATQAAAGVGSWWLPGNHDLYGGARAFFTVLLGDPRFARQRGGDGRPTSWFRLLSPGWQVIGLDSAWNDDPFEHGQTGLLEDPQTAQVQQWLAEAGARKTLVLTHHQFMTVYDDRLRHAAAQPPLLARLGPLVADDAITGWIWGHEHRCMAFAHDHLPFARCLGHGGQLLEAHAPGDAPPAPATWEETAAFADGGRRWNAFGFAVLDVDGPQIAVRYHVDGAQPVVAEEQLS